MKWKGKKNKIDFLSPPSSTHWNFKGRKNIKLFSMLNAEFWCVRELRKISFLHWNSNNGSRPRHTMIWLALAERTIFSPENIQSMNMDGGKESTWLCHIALARFGHNLHSTFWLFQPDMLMTIVIRIRLHKTWLSSRLSHSACLLFCAVQLSVFMFSSPLCSATASRDRLRTFWERSRRRKITESWNRITLNQFPLRIFNFLPPSCPSAFFSLSFSLVWSVWWWYDRESNAGAAQLEWKYVFSSFHTPQRAKSIDKSIWTRGNFNFFRVHKLTIHPSDSWSFVRWELEKRAAASVMKAESDR